MSFSDITGQEQAVSSLLRMLRSGRVPHALVFSGPAGVGRMTAAVEFAKSILCPEADVACGKCPSCRRVDARTHPDVFIQGHTTGRATISVGDVRELSARIAESPLEAEAKVAIVDPADAMTPEAQNAFLKTLEEPPPDTTIILVAENTDALLATVRSRCRRVRFVPAADEAVKAFLDRKGASADAAVTIARLADGSYGGALALAEGTFVEDRREFVKAILSAGPGDEEKVAEALAGGARKKKAAREKREEAIALLSALHSVLVDAIRLAAGADARVNTDLAQNIRAFAAEADLDALTALEKEVSDAIIALGQYADVRLIATRVASAFSRRPEPSGYTR